MSAVGLVVIIVVETAALATVAGLWLREHYMTPLVTSHPNLPGSAWIVSQWYTKGGKFAFPAHGTPIVSALSRFCLTCLGLDWRR